MYHLQQNVLDLTRHCLFVLFVYANHQCSIQYITNELAAVY